MSLFSQTKMFISLCGMFSNNQDLIIKSQWANWQEIKCDKYIVYQAS